MMDEWIYWGQTEDDGFKRVFAQSLVYGWTAWAWIFNTVTWEKIEQHAKIAREYAEQVKLR